jgi:hypothetical protein
MNVLKNYYIRFHLLNSIIREQTLTKINPLSKLAANLEIRDQRDDPNSSIP